MSKMDLTATTPTKEDDNIPKQNIANATKKKVANGSGKNNAIVKDKTSSSPHPPTQRKLELTKDFSILNTSTMFDLFRAADIIIEKLDDKGVRGFSFGDASDAGQFMEVAILHGANGIGKSSIALKCADTLFHRRDVNVVFWIDYQNYATIQQSFTTIALEMKLPCTELKDHEENRCQVLTWLTETMCNWLVVYNNVESMDLLKEDLPHSCHGRVLVTTQDSSFAVPRPRSWEFEPWVLQVNYWCPGLDVKGLSMHPIHTLSTGIGSEISRWQDNIPGHDDTKQSAGHALATFQLDGLIYKREPFFSEDVEDWKSRPRDNLDMGMGLKHLWM